MLAIELDELAAEGEPGQLLEEKQALTPTARAQFADQLLVSGLAPSRGSDPRYEFAISHTPRLEPVLHFARVKVREGLQATLKVTRGRLKGAQEPALCRRMWETADPGKVQMHPVWILAAETLRRATIPASGIVFYFLGSSHWPRLGNSQS